MRAKDFLSPTCFERTRTRVLVVRCRHARTCVKGFLDPKRIARTGEKDLDDPCRLGRANPTALDVRTRIGRAKLLGLEAPKGKDRPKRLLKEEPKRVERLPAFVTPEALPLYPEKPFCALPEMTTQPPRRCYVTLPGLLLDSIRERRKEFDYPSFSPYGLELICFDLRERHEHWVTQPWATDERWIQDAIDREIVSHYRPKSPRNKSLMYQLLDLAKDLKASPPQPIERGLFASQRDYIWIPHTLVELVKTRWTELKYQHLSAYVTGLIRYDLMLSGPHKYFHGSDTDPDLLRALDIETATEFQARKRRRILLDYLIEEAAGRPLSDEERIAEMKRLAAKLRENALAARKRLALTTASAE